MAEKVEMIQLSPTMEEGVVVEWLRKEGDSVSTGDLIAEIETDKATMEMESYFDGTLLRILVPAGQSARVGTTLAIVGEPGEDIDHLLTDAPADPQPTAGADADAKGDKGDKGGKGDKGDKGGKGDKGDSDTNGAESAGDEQGGHNDGGTTTQPRDDGERIFASPVARNIARAEGLALEQISGSGPQGRIIKRDVEQALRAAGGAGATHASAPAAGRDASPASRAPAQHQPRGEASATQASAERLALSPMRKAIARNLSQAWQAPAFMLTRTIRMDALVELRARINEATRDGGTRVSVNDLLIRGCALALHDVPDMNVAWDGDAILRYQRADVGVAVAIEGGLITPIIRDAGALGVATIARRMKDLAERARDRKLQPDEFTGATFSISNLGMYGIDHFTAVLNPPAAGILAVGATRTVPVVGDDGGISTEQQMSVTLTCDHRAVDGATGALFLQALTRYLEHPLLMLV